MRTRLLCALCGPLALLILSGALSGCGKASSGAVTEEHPPVASHALPSKQSAVGMPLANSSAPATPPSRGRAIALELDDGSRSSVLDRFEIHK